MSDHTVKDKGENKMKRYGIFVIVVLFWSAFLVTFLPQRKFIQEKIHNKRHQRYSVCFPTEQFKTCLGAKDLMKWLKLWFISCFRFKLAHVALN